MLPRFLPRDILRRLPATPPRERFVCPECGAFHIPPVGSDPGECWYCKAAHGKSVRLEREDSSGGLWAMY